MSPIFSRQIDIRLANRDLSIQNMELFSKYLYIVPGLPTHAHTPVAAYLILTDTSQATDTGTDEPILPTNHEHARAHIRDDGGAPCKVANPHSGNSHGAGGHNIEPVRSDDVAPAAAEILGPK